MISRGQGKVEDVEGCVGEGQDREEVVEEKRRREGEELERKERWRIGDLIKSRVRGRQRSQAEN